MKNKFIIIFIVLILLFLGVVTYYKFFNVEKKDNSNDNITKKNMFLEGLSKKYGLALKYNIDDNENCIDDISSCIFSVDFENSDDSADKYKDKVEKTLKEINDVLEEDGDLAAAMCPKNSLSCIIIAKDEVLENGKKMMIECNHFTNFGYLSVTGVGVLSADGTYKVINPTYPYLYLRSFKINEKKYISLLAVITGTLMVPGEKIEVYTIDLNLNETYNEEDYGYLLNSTFTTDGYEAIVMGDLYNNDSTFYQKDDELYNPNSVVAAKYSYKYIGNGKYGNRVKLKDITAGELFLLSEQ